MKRAWLLLSLSLVGAGTGCTKRPPQCGGTEERCEPEDEHGPYGCIVRRDAELEPQSGTADPTKPPLLLDQVLTADGQAITHMLPAEQALYTPVPMYIEPPWTLTIKKVVVRYKPFGSSKWMLLEMKAMGVGFGGEIPCRELQTTGHLKYHIVLLDEDGNPIDNMGSRKEPLVVAIKNSLEGGFPSLPGHAPSKPCGRSHPPAGEDVNPKNNAPEKPNDDPPRSL